MELAPFSSPRVRRVDGCRGFVGPCPSTPLDAYGYVWSGRIPTCPDDSSWRPNGRVRHGRPRRARASPRRPAPFGISTEAGGFLRPQVESVRRCRRSTTTRSDAAMPNLPKPRLRRSTRRRGDAGVAQPTAERNVEVVEHGGLRWINIERPGPLDQAWLEEHFEFHPLDYEDVRSRNQRPKIDVYDDYLFIVLHFPVFDKQVGRLNTGELDAFVGPDYLITIPNVPLQPVEYLFERCRSNEQVREDLFSKGPGYLLYKVVDSSFDYCFPMLRKIGNKLDRLEGEIFEGRSEEVVRDISNAKQEIINFRKIIRPQRPVLRDLERTKQRYLAPEMDVYFDDIVDASERIWDMLENYKEVVEALEDTNESVLSHRVNDVLRILTSFNLVILPLTLIGTIWGMNVAVPGQGSIEAFWLIIAGMVVVLTWLVVFFKRRGWL